MIGLDKEVAQLQQLPTDERIRGLKKIIPCTTIKAILKKTGHLGRACSRLPAWFMVWFVVGLGLFHGDSYRQVFRWLQAFRNRLVPGRSTLCEARRRLGVAPMRYLFETIVRLLASAKAAPRAFYRGMRLLGIDGFVLDLPDTPDNSRIFGKPKGGRTPGAFPQARVLALCEIGTHVIWRFLIKPLCRGEAKMVGYLLGFVTKGTLLLWDRGFFSYANVLQVVQSGGHLLARVKIGLIFKVIRRFPDGSYLSKVYRSPKHRAKDQDGILVRIIEYTFNDPQRPGKGERHRLLTTLLDWNLDPAKTLIVLYHQRWEEELAFDELKTHQRGSLVLKSETPAGVVQEVYGLLLAHFVVRKLMFDAAVAKGIEPLRLSFTGTLKILRCRLAECPKSRRGLRRWYADLLAEVGEETLEPRRDRVNPRVVKRKMSKWPKKGVQHLDYPQPRKKIEQAIQILR